ncbi:MAG TPA: hypothetical protein VEA18_01245 [Candidatus Kapabacteria bacterium]|nr:hypothetical protein [Candidatus Kapabacteria bacterium]
MFGRSKKEGQQQPEASFHLTTMPDIFYGGKNPVVQYDQTSVAALPLQKSTPKVTPSVGVPAQQGKSPAKKMPFILGGSVLFLLAVAGITWYYLKDAGMIRKNTLPVAVEENTPPAVSPPEIVPEIIVTSTLEAVVTTTEALPTSTPSLREVPLDFPRQIYTDSTDLDIDSLTDIEEDLFGTDSATYDSDEDGYYDGQEVANLYNPKGKAPVKIIDSGLVQEYVHPTFQYRVYYPSGWEVAAVDSSANQVIFSAITGDYIEVRSYKKEVNETFSAWFGRVAVDQSFTDLEKFENRFSIEGYRRGDSVVAYFEKDQMVYVFLYHSAGSTIIPFRHVMNMMVQSFRPTRVSLELPEQAVLPSTTTTSASPSFSPPTEENI